MPQSPKPLTAPSIVLFVIYSDVVFTLDLRPDTHDFQLCNKPDFTIDDVASYVPDENDGPIFRTILSVAQAFGVSAMEVEVTTRHIKLSHGGVDLQQFADIVKDELEHAGIRCTHAEFYDEAAAAALLAEAPVER